MAKGRGFKPVKAVVAFTGTVTRTHGRHHFVSAPDGKLYEAHRRGKKADVVVGDTVDCTEPQGDVVAIEAIHARTNLLYRSDEWRIKELASNLTLVAVVIASRPTFNPWFVWKASIAAKTAGIPLVIVRNKKDLTDKAQEIEEFCQLMADDCGAEVIHTSAEKHPDETRAILSERFAGERVLLVGQSGMGKSTILNALIPEAQAKTREFSEALDLGKQTTTTTAMYTCELLGKKTEIIDSPGFQEFGLAHVTATDIQQAMPDIVRHIEGCRFYNCTHTKEPGCSVKKAVEDGLINSERYAFYCALIAAL
ncbi:MAG: ribosome small subunit-dependent GTPase A [Sutterellaceae bacterium]|nr:ribosome small subunit-dependent GTPase A [Sutterellaceae bacterium]